MDFFFHLHVSLRACHPSCHTIQAQDTERLVLIKGIKCYSDSQGVGLHMKTASGYLAFMVEMCGLLSMTAAHYTAAIALQLLCPLNT